MKVGIKIKVRKNNSFIHLMFIRYLARYEGGCKAGLTTHHFTWAFPGFNNESPISGNFFCPRQTEMAGHPKNSSTVKMPCKILLSTNLVSWER